MKVICVDSQSETLVAYLKPDNALNFKRLPFFLPDFSKSIVARMRVAVRIDRIAKCVEQRFASKYYSEVALGIEFLASDIIGNARNNGLPWTLGTSFDDSLVLSETVAKEVAQGKEVGLMHNGHLMESGVVETESIDSAIARLSETMKLKTGDWALMAVGQASDRLSIGDVLQVRMEPLLSLDLAVK